MINKYTLTAYLESLKTDMISSSSNIHAMFEEIDPLDEMLRESREKNKLTYFKPVGKEETVSGIRYYEVKTETGKTSMIRYIDVTSNGISSPSEWFEVDADDEGMFFVDGNSKKQFIGDLEYNDSLEKIPLPTPKEEPKPEPKKVKAFKQPLLDKYTTWVSLINYNDADGKLQTSKLGIIYTNSPSFPNRTFLDKIRFITNGVVTYGKKEGRDTVLSKSKQSNNFFVVSIQKSSIEMNKDGLAKSMVAYNDLMTPDEFIDKLRDINFK